MAKFKELVAYVASVIFFISFPQKISELMKQVPKIKNIKIYKFRSYLRTDPSIHESHWSHKKKINVSSTTLCTSYLKLKIKQMNKKVTILINKVRKT